MNLMNESAVDLYTEIVNKKTISEVMRAMGRKGGKKGGKSRMELLTPEERKELGRMAGRKSGEARAKKAAKKKSQ
jgi:general stress protein YciG